jgi:hypothetical protein
VGGGATTKGGRRPLVAMPQSKDLFISAKHLFVEAKDHSKARNVDHIYLVVLALFCRRRHQPGSPPPAKIRPGRPAPATGPGTAAAGVVT